ncbi:aspartate/glutamate racemase family protein [Ancylobacter radicis]|uniref:Aspartate/glutamate racemase family protein n=1 Tax=Ancylobacter radicis TaxID=2836179 RepID=A0ABS5R686_9HYPH|nr:aspartate/glutamate racemase family protein [Ancylobacter radicis]MBS9477176.1 aspartate/glutamate racemase family protein [Ancylobacter radicis]
MRIHLINPNTTASMTEKAAAAARMVASPGTQIVAVTSSMGPASIEGFYDDALALPGLLAAIAAAEQGTGKQGVGGIGGPVDAHIIACFDDTGLDAARTLARAPVVGIGEAGFHLASLIAHRFAVVTTLARSVPVIEANLARYGLLARCCAIRASDVAVLELEDPASDARGRISDEIGRAIRADKAEAIVLGCAGMADLARSLSVQHGVPVIDGVASAVTLAEGLVRTGLATSKLGPYAAPRVKPYAGRLADFAPRGD